MINRIEDTSETIKFQCKFCKQKRTAPFNQTSNLFKHLHYDKKHKDNQDIQNWLKKYESYKKSKKNDISPLSIKKNRIQSIETILLEDFLTNDLIKEPALAKVKKILKFNDLDTIINQIKQVNVDMIELINHKLDESLDVCLVVNVLKIEVSLRILVFSALCLNDNQDNELFILDVKLVGVTIDNNSIEKELKRLLDENYKNFNRNKIKGINNIYLYSRNFKVIEIFLI